MKKILKKETLMILGIFFMAVNLRTGISSISPLAESIQEIFGISSFKLSLLTSVPVICMGIFAFFSPKLIEKLGYKKSIMTLIFIISFFILIRAVKVNYLYFLMTAFGVGIPTAIIGPRISTYIKNKFPHHVASMIGIYSVGMGLSAAIASGFTLGIRHMFGGSVFLALASWSIPGFISLLLLIKFLPKENLEVIEKRKIVFPLKNKKVWVLVMIFGLQSGIFYSLVTWLGPLGIESGLDEKGAAFYIALFTAIQTVFSLLIPVFINKSKKYKTAFSACVFFVIIGLIFLINYKLLIGVIFAGIGTGGLFPIAMIFPLEECEDPKESTSYVSMVQAFGYVLSGITPIILGVFRDKIGNYNNSFYILLFISTVLIFLPLGIRKSK